MKSEKASLNIKTLFSDKAKKTKESISNFNDEVEEAFEHFKKAIQSFRQEIIFLFPQERMS